MIRATEMLPNLGNSSHHYHSNNMSGGVLTTTDTPTDLFITRGSDSAQIKPYVMPTGFSDHSAIHMRLPLYKPPLQRKEISYRKLCSIDKDTFRTDLQESSFVSGAAVHKDVNVLVSSYNTCLSELLKKHAPLCKKVLMLRPNSPWFSNQLQSEKKLKHSLERQGDSTAFKEQANRYYSLIDKAKEEYFKDRITSSGHDQKKVIQNSGRSLEW